MALIHICAPCVSVIRLLLAFRDIVAGAAVIRAETVKEGVLLGFLIERRVDFAGVIFYILSPGTCF